MILINFLLNRKRNIIDSKIDSEKLKSWLFKNYEDIGFKSYYTLRKNNIKDLLAIGVEGKEYWKLLGRLEELHSLKENIEKEFKHANDKSGKKGEESNGEGVRV